MSYQAIKEYLMKVCLRYKNLTKKEKTKLLNEAVIVTELSRKHVIKLLGTDVAVLAKKKSSGRHKKYPPELLLTHIQYLWIQMERISAKRMKAAFPDWLPMYKDPSFTSQIRFLLEKMSVSSLERFLVQCRKSQSAGKGLSTTCPARYMKNKIPINTFDSKVDRPGFTQSDTVAHCGSAIGGEYAHSITLTDLFSTWTENRAIYTKKGIEVRRQFNDLDQSVPFEILAINTDSGTEFLNNQVVQFMRREGGKKEIHFTRSRPYKKNDNCYVEQKNYTHVRELFGYERIEDPSLIALMNDIYKTCWNPLQNYFIPTLKLKEKIRVGGKIRKKHDWPKTPCDRLLDSPHISEERKNALRQTKLKLNPFDLKAELEKKLKIFFDLLRKSKERKAA